MRKVNNVSAVSFLQKLEIKAQYLFKGCSLNNLNFMQPATGISGFFHLNIENILDISNLKHWNVLEISILIFNLSHFFHLNIGNVLDISILNTGNCESY